ncbi:MAG: hypothetical protein A3E38_01000 [Candidatus Moranbacteria bacterium RIFCSPHIGHO2_12_FULL_54_9]|nr:MAG: hypothetical protein A2878_00165 [Candidatus Moranbacteria bacterium RIFCSPHIGHO2_01_FULL_54_31]OGI25491.1 MAG: hypothetical protein A3E38_01000 [Candidatus Moranbacteria bacterium RIFCSPHIGHO2_12_FULL_54_9]
MKILEINKFYYPRRGAERHFLDLIGLLRASGHRVAVFAMDDPRNVSRTDERYFVSPVGYNPDDANVWQRLCGIGRLFWSFEARKKIAAMLAAYQPDIVHIHNIYHQLSLSILPIIRRSGTPIVMTVHDYHSISPDKDEYYDFVGKRYWKFLLVKKYSLGKRVLLVMKMYWGKLFRFYERAIDVYIAPSEYCKSVLVKGGIQAEKIVVVPHFVKEPTEEISRQGQGSEPYALYFGGITEEKSIRELCTLFAELHFPLLLAGAKQTDILEGRYVRSVGEKNRADLEELIRNACLVVSASHLPETFGLIVLEANILGKPFFGYATGAYPEIVAQGKNGWLASDRSTLRQMIADFIGDKVRCETADTIACETREKYGTAAYMQKLDQIFTRIGTR